MLKGALDEATEFVTGWAFDDDDIFKTVWLEIVINDTAVLTIICDQPRPDLVHLPGNALVGFRANISDHLVVGQNEIVVRFRDSSIQLDGAPKYYGFEGLVSSKVLIGKESWLFLQNDSGKSLDLLQGLVSLPIEDIVAFIRQQHIRECLCRATGSRFLCLIIPEKFAIYPEKLPDSVYPSDERPALSIIDAARSASVSYLYYLDEYLAQFKSETLYYLTDTHLNDRGLDKITDFICAFFDLISTAENKKAFVTREYSGNLGCKLLPPCSEFAEFMIVQDSEPTLVLSTFNKSDWNQPGKTGTYKFIENNRAANKFSILVIGTSSASMLADHFSHLFNKVVSYWSNEVGPEIISSVRPDYVVFVQAERYISRPDADIYNFVEKNYEKHQLFLAQAAAFLAKST